MSLRTPARTRRRSLIEVSTDDHCLKCRENLLVCQISSGPKENKCIRFEILHFLPPILTSIPFPFFCMSSKPQPHNGCSDCQEGGLAQ